MTAARGAVLTAGPWGEGGGRRELDSLPLWERRRRHVRVPLVGRFLRVGLGFGEREGAVVAQLCELYCEGGVVPVDVGEVAADVSFRPQDVALVAFEDV